MPTYFPFEFPYYFYVRITSIHSYIQLWTIPKSIPPEYDKSNTGIQTDPEENM